MNKTALIILGLVLATVAGIAGGYAIWGRGQYSFPLPPDINSITPSCAPSSKVILEDSFVLASHRGQSKEEESERQQYWQELDSKYGKNWLDYVELPFNKYGQYFNVLFLQEGETIEVRVRCTEPIAIEGIEQMEAPGLLMDIFYSNGEIPYSTERELERVNGDWELRFDFTARASERHMLWIGNEIASQLWCQYVITLK